MYSPESIQSLIDRIGFADKVEVSQPFTLTPEVILSNSGRNVKSFHQLAIVENIFSAVPQINMPDIDFNNYLQEMKSQSALEVLALILDRSIDYDTTVDYSTWMIDRPAIFDDAYGYTIAIKCIELFVSSARKNFRERNANLAYQTLVIELEGARDQNGRIAIQGLYRKRNYAVQQAKNIIFPVKIIVDGTKEW